MIQALLLRRIDKAPNESGLSLQSSLRASSFAITAVLACGVLAAQAITIDTSGRSKGAANAPVDRQFSQIEPTHVDIPKTELDPKTRLELIRALEAEHGFAMRPFPRGHKGLTLEANGKLEPAGENYLNMVVSEGLSAKPGAQIVITDVKFERSKIIFDLNDGPDAKHRFLRHIQIGVGPDTTDPNVDPSLANQAGDPAGSRLTLAFADHVPELTPAQVKSLLAPLVSFDVKSPIQAFTDTLPKELKDAILSHKVLVGMSTDMVIFAKGQPVTKSREIDGQMPFEEWIYGTPPEEVDFVRVNGNRVIQVEVAKDGEPLQVFTEDVVSPMLVSNGSPVLAATTRTRTVREGDVQTDPDRQAPAAPPSLRSAGESSPADNQNLGVMRPVQMPKPHTDDQLGANPDEQSQSAPATGSPDSQPDSATKAAPKAQPAPANATQPAPQPAPSAAPSSNFLQSDNVAAASSAASHDPARPN